jgi:hypothetical protein
MSFICEEIDIYLKKSTSTGKLITKTRVGSFPPFVQKYSIRVFINRHSYPQDTKIDLDKILNYAEVVLRWISTLNWSTPLNELNVTLTLAPHVKKFCWNASSTITKCNINSGETEFFPGLKREIRVWRREDYHKVLIHELLHAFNWDRLVNDKNINAIINQRNKRESEGFIEAVALLLHVLIIGGKEWVRIWEIERRLTAKQMILLQKHTWKNENTNINEYIFVKAALLLDKKLLKIFFKWLTQNKTVEETNKTWPTMVDKGLLETQSILNNLYNTDEKFRFDVEQTYLSGCVPLHLVTSQLPLNPRRIA